MLIFFKILSTLYGCCIDWSLIETIVGGKTTYNGGKDKQNDLLEWNKLSHMEKQDEGSLVCDEIASVGFYYN